VVSPLAMQQFLLHPHNESGGKNGEKRQQAEAGVKMKVPVEYTLKGKKLKTQDKEGGRSMVHIASIESSQASHRPSQRHN